MKEGVHLTGLSETEYGILHSLIPSIIQLRTSFIDVTPLFYCHMHATRGTPPPTTHDSRTLHNNIYLLVVIMVLRCFWASIGRAFLIYFTLPHLFIAFSAFINIIHFPSLLLSPLSSQVQWNERSSQNGCKSFIRNSTSWYETPQTKQTWTIISYYHVYTVDIYIKCVTMQ